MNKRGAVLIEVLAAITILSMAGVSSTAFLATTVDAHVRLRTRERELAAAERVLIATALLTRAELGQRIGMREVREFAVWVDRPEPSLFRIGVSHRERPSVELLATLVYRPAFDEITLPPAEAVEPVQP